MCGRLRTRTSRSIAYAHACAPLRVGAKRTRREYECEWICNPHPHEPSTDLEEAKDVGDHDALGGNGGPDDARHGLDGQLGHRRLLVAALELVRHVQAPDVPAHEVDRLLHRIRVHRACVPDVHAKSQACASVWRSLIILIIRTYSRRAAQAPKKSKVLEYKNTNAALFPHPFYCFQ